MSKPTAEEMLDWLEKRINAPCILQLSHPHLAWYPTEQDKEIYQAIRSCIKNGDKKLELIRVINHDHDLTGRDK